MAFRSVRARLLVLYSALVVGTMAATLAYVSVLADRAVDRRIGEDLARSRTTIAAAQADRAEALSLVARLVASFPSLRGLFKTDDRATVRDFLSDFRQRHARSELLIAIDGGERVLARSDTFAPLSIPRLREEWLDPAEQGRPVVRDLDIDGKAYRGAISAAEIGGTVFGFVLAAAPIDDAWAGALRDASDMEIVILSPSGVVGSTLPRARVAWRTTAEIPSSADAGAPMDVIVGGEHFQAVVVPGDASSGLRVVSLQSRDLALAPYRNLQVGLLVLGLIAAGLGVAVSAVLSRSLTQPIGQLVEATRHVAEGRYDRPLTLVRADELGDLAASFNLMTAGLRERADMQKFVSHSTVEMIQRHSPAEEQGARREITLLFCDIRGFTAFAAERPPEEAVRVLNRYLHLQADLVTRGGGDIDKFMGDAVFAHFVGPEMALDAIKCAVEIQRAVRQAPVGDTTLPPLAVGIGIATGDVIVGSIGSADRLDYTAVGPAVNLASRLCAAAEPHEILLSESTFAMVRDLIAAEPVAPLVVKGFTEPVRAYRMALRAG